MAVTQLYNRITNLNGLIEYVMNGDKTDEMKYVSDVNCLPETAYEEMIATKNRFNRGKEKNYRLSSNTIFCRRRSYTRSCS